MCFCGVTLKHFYCVSVLRLTLNGAKCLKRGSKLKLCSGLTAKLNSALYKDTIRSSVELSARCSLQCTEWKMMFFFSIKCAEAESLVFFSLNSGRRQDNGSMVDVNQADFVKSLAKSSTGQ